MRQILLIDDDPLANYINHAIIKKKYGDSEVLAFENGRLALNYINRYKSNTYLIFLDLNMPVMNGWQFLDKIQELKSNIDLKIFILSSSVDSLDISRAQKINIVSSYLIKPLKLKDLPEIDKFV